LNEAVKHGLREMYRTLDPVALLAEMRKLRLNSANALTVAPELPL
jgi:hypothetical protein